MDNLYLIMRSRYQGLATNQTCETCGQSGDACKKCREDKTYYSNWKSKDEIGFQIVDDTELTPIQKEALESLILN